MTDGIWLLIGLLFAALTALAYDYLNNRDAR